MSQDEKDLVSRRTLARNMRSKIRSEEYQKKRFRNLLYMWLSLALGVGVPMLFYGGIEYGYWHKPESIPFELYSSLAWLVVMFAFLRTWEQQRKYQERDDQLLKLEMEILGLDEGEPKSRTA